MSLPLDDNLPPEWAARVQAELRNGERLVWAEQPQVKGYLRRSMPVVLFGIPFTAFALFWVSAAWVMLFGFPGDERNAVGPGLPFNLFPYFGIPFVLVGVGMLCSPLGYWRRAKGTCYALTSLRAIIWEAGMFGAVRVRSYEPGALGKMIRVDHPDGSGDLVLEQLVVEGTDSDGHRTTRTTQYGFIAVRNVKQVEDLVRRTLVSSPGR